MHEQANLTPALREPPQAVIAHPRMSSNTVIPIYDPTRFAHMKEIAMMMAGAPLVPDHLRSGSQTQAMSNCFMVVNQAYNWGMDPFAVAQSTFVTKGKIGFDGKLISAVITAKTGIELQYNFFGKEGTPGRGVVATDGRREVKGTVDEWRTPNSMWDKQPDDQLIYRASRQWARRYAPGVMLGVYSNDEVEAFRGEAARDITPAARALPEPEARTAPAQELLPPEPKKAAAKTATKAAAKAPEKAPEPEAMADSENPEPGATEPEDHPAGDTMLTADAAEEFLMRFEDQLQACADKPSVLALLNANSGFISSRLNDEHTKRAQGAASRHLKRTRAGT